MSQARIERAPQALLDIAEAVDWYLERSPTTAGRFLGELETSLERVRRSPLLWRVTTAPARRCLLRGFPFAIVYEVHEDVVLVIAVAHASRKPEYWQSAAD